MDEKSSHSTTETSHLIPQQLLLHRVEDLKSRPQPHYESAGARATRMVIELSSYRTTPCSSPPNELCDLIHGPNTRTADIQNGMSYDAPRRPEQKEYDKNSTQGDQDRRNSREMPENGQAWPLLLPKRPAQKGELANNDTILESRGKK